MWHINIYFSQRKLQLYFRVRHRTILYNLKIICKCVCVRARTHACVRACVHVCVCRREGECVCVAAAVVVVDADMCKVLNCYLVPVCLCSHAHPTSRHFLCGRTWWIKNLNLNVFWLCQGCPQNFPYSWSLSSCPLLSSLKEISDPVSPSDFQCSRQSSALGLHCIKLE